MTKVTCPEPGSQMTTGSVTAPMTEPTPRSTPKKMTAVEIEKYMLNLESSLARQSALLRDIEAAMRSPGTNMVGLQTLLKRIESELKG